MLEVNTIGLDLAKNVFQAHGADGLGAVLFRRKLRRNQILRFLADQPACTVAMEACAGSHYLAREIAKLGHEVRLIAPGYVKPFVKRQKNDAADAEAIRVLLSGQLTTRLRRSLDRGAVIRCWPPAQPAS